MTPVVDWTRAAIVGALAGAAFWAIAVHAVMTSEGSAVVVTAICVVAFTAIAVGAVLYRRHGNIRAYGAGLILAPLTGAAPLVVFCLGALIFQLIAK